MAANSQTATWVDKTINMLRSGIFGTLFAVNKELPVARRSFLLAMLVEFLQMLAFTVNISPELPWADQSAMLPFSQFLSFITTDSADQTHSIAAFRVMLAIAAAWTSVFLLLTGIVAYSFVTDAPQNVLVLRALRSIATLSTTILFIPFTSVLFRGLACPDEGNGWFGLGISCGGAPRVILAIFLVILLLGFSGMSIFVAAVFIDRSPTSRSWSARVSGRVDVFMLALKLVLGFIYNVIPQVLLGTWILTVILILSGAAWFYLYFSQMPLAHPLMNVIQAGFALGYAWTAVALGLQQTIGGNAPDRIYIVTPIVIAFGAAVMYVHYRRIRNKSLHDCSSLYEVDVWCRACLHQYAALAGQADDGSGKAGHSQGIPGDTDAEDDAEPTLTADEMPTADEEDPADAADTEDDKERSPLLKSNANRHGAGTRSRQTSKSADPNLYDTDMSEAAQLGRERQRLLDNAEEGYRYMMHHFGNQELSFLFAAVFFRDHWTFQFNEAMALARVKRKDPAPDIRFYIYQRGRQLRESDKAGMSPLDRVLYDQYWKETVELRTEASRATARLWEALSEKEPDMAQLQTVGVQLQDAIGKINQRFHQLLQLNADSTSTLRAYATHLIEFANEAGRAQELLNKAERLDDKHSKDQAHNMRHVVYGATKRSGASTADLMDDTNALVTISGDPSNVGEILFVSPAACRVFGYGSSQMVGQSVSVIVPPPIRAYHDYFLRRFSKKRSSRIVGNTRAVFGVTRGGTLIPIWLSVMEAPPDEETLAPRFTAVIKPINTDENHVLFLGPERGFRVMAGSDRSLDMLGVEPEALQSGHISLLHWFPSASPSFSREETDLDPSQVSQLQSMPSMMDMARRLNSAVGQRQQPPASRAKLVRAASKKMQLEPSFQNVLESMTGEYEGRVTTEAWSSEDAPAAAPENHDDPLSRAIGGVGGTQLEAAQPNPPRAEVKPLLKLQKTGLIPVQHTVEGTDMLVGSVQRVGLPSLPTFYLLRWHSLDAGYGGFFNEQGLQAKEMHKEVLDDGESIGSDTAVGSRSSGEPAVGENRRTPVTSDPPAAGALRPPPKRTIGGEGSPQENQLLGTGLGDPIQSTVIAEEDNETPSDHQVGVPEIDTHVSDRKDTVGRCTDEDIMEGLGPDAQVVVDEAGNTVRADARHSDATPLPSEQRPLVTDGTAASQPFQEHTDDSGKRAPPPPPIGSQSVREETDQVDSSPTWADGALATNGRPEERIVTADSGGVTPSGASRPRRSSLRKQRRTSLNHIGGAGTPPPVEKPSAPLAKPPQSKSRRERTEAKSVRSAGLRSRRTGGGGKSSVGSGGSQSTQLSRQLAMLTRFRDPEVGHVRGVMLFLVGMMFIMAGVATFWMELTRDRLGSLARGLWLSGFRLHEIHESVMLLNRIESANRGLPSQRDPDGLHETLANIIPDVLSVGEELFELRGRGGTRGFEFETDTDVVFAQLSDDGTRAIINRSLPVSSAGDAYTSALARLGRGERENVVGDDPDYRLLIENFDTIQAALSRSSILRQFDLVEMFPRVERELLIGGGVGFFLTVVISTALFVSVARRLGSKTSRVLQVFMMIPRSVAKSLHERANARLQRVVVSEQMVFMGDTGDGGAEQNEAQEEEDRLMVEEEEADAKLQKVMRRHARTRQNSRLRSQAEGTGNESTIWLRPWVDSSHYVLKTSAKLLLPAFLVFVWLGVMVLVQYLNNEDTRESTFRMSATQEVEGHASLWGHRLTTFMSRDDPSMREPLLDPLEEIGAQLQADLEFIRLGGTRQFDELGRVARLDALQDDGTERYSLLLVDACPASSQEAACRELQDGVLRDGTTSGLFTMSNTVERIVGNVMSNDTLRQSQEELVRVPRIRESYHSFLELYDPHIDEALERVSELLEADIRSILDETNTILRVFNWTFVAAFVLGMIMAYSPVTASVMSPLRSARDLLRMMPMELVDSMPEIREEMQDVVTHAEDGTLGRRKANVRQRQGQRPKKSRCGLRWCGSGNGQDSPAQTHPEQLVTRDLSQKPNE